jgi:cation transport regulator ChaC
LEGSVKQVFAYGSLMGDAALARYRARPARLPDYHRAFLHESLRRWGQPDSPCPILGLSPGGECWGLVFDVPDADRPRVMRALEKREAARERRRETHTVETPDGPTQAVVWVSRGGNGGRAAGPGSNLEVLEARLRAAHGVVGTGTEYVRELVHAMELHGIRDELVDTLCQRLRG